jgi:hypothetical protein
MQVPIAVGIHREFFLDAREIVSINSSETRFVRINVRVDAMGWRWIGVFMRSDRWLMRWAGGSLAIRWRWCGDRDTMVVAVFMR